jgi:hypothetical protein
MLMTLARVVAYWIAETLCAVLLEHLRSPLTVFGAHILTASSGLSHAMPAIP